jgi:hypothetical protein
MQQIVTCGIPRSGSTLVWQILQAVFPDQEIIKTHPDIWSEVNEGIIIASIRNPYDVVASLLRVRLSRQKTDEAVKDDIEAVLKRTVLSFEKLNILMDNCFNYILRYEYFYKDYSLIYDMIRSVFVVNVSADDRNNINSRFSLENNKKRADDSRDFNQVGEDKIHGDHIGHVHPGYWSEYLPSWSLERVKEICEPLCKEWGYEDK